MSETASIAGEQPTSGKSSLHISAIYFLNLIFSLLFQMYVASRFGASREMDIFLVATTVVLFFSASITNPVKGVFVPSFTERQNLESGKEWIFSNNTLLILSFITISISIIISLCARNILGIVTSGSGPSFSSSDASLLQIQAASIPFVVISQVVMLVLNCNSKYIASTFSMLLIPTFTILGAMSFSYLGVTSLGVGVLLGSMCQTAFLLINYFREARSHNGIRLSTLVSVTL